MDRRSPTCRHIAKILWPPVWQMVEVQAAYAIGVVQPVSVMVDTKELGHPMRPLPMR